MPWHAGRDPGRRRTRSLLLGPARSGAPPGPRTSGGSAPSEVGGRRGEFVTKAGATDVPWRLRPPNPSQGNRAAAPCVGSSPRTSGTVVRPQAPVLTRARPGASERGGGYNPVSFSTLVATGPRGSVFAPWADRRSRVPRGPGGLTIRAGRGWRRGPRGCRRTGPGRGGAAKPRRRTVRAGPGWVGPSRGGRAPGPSLKRGPGCPAPLPPGYGAPRGPRTRPTLPPTEEGAHPTGREDGPLDLEAGVVGGE